MAWKGNPNNPVPNTKQSSYADLSEKKDVIDRSTQVRRDNDTVGNFSINISDIDEVVVDHLHSLDITVTDNGNKVKVPILYANPERWKAIKNDGYLRDANGKIQLPVLVFSRSGMDHDAAYMTFNRHLTYPILLKYSQKNRYTKFNILNKNKARVGEIYNIRMPDHMTFNYSFMVWTEKNEQMNDIIQTINFSLNDYWFSKKGARFRVSSEPYTHTTEVGQDDNRYALTEFSITLRGYILPNVIDATQVTTQKQFSIKKVVLNESVVDDLPPVIDKSNYHHPDYPNKKLNDVSGKILPVEINDVF